MTKKYQVLMEEEKKDEKKENSAPDPLAEKFLKTRQILLSGEICEELAEKIVRQLLILEADNSDPIYVYIDSPGGDVYAGFAIFDTIRFISAPVYIVGMGLIASAAALILLSVPKERRVGLPHSSYLIHQPSSGMKGVATDIERVQKSTKLSRNRRALLWKKLRKIPTVIIGLTRKNRCSTV
jgi:ATP-dependent Clp protease protease subunit